MPVGERALIIMMLTTSEAPDSYPNPFACALTTSRTIETCVALARKHRLGRACACRRSHSLPDSPLISSSRVDNPRRRRLSVRDQFGSPPVRNRLTDAPLPHAKSPALPEVRS
jgi:hypothetical protein